MDKHILDLISFCSEIDKFNNKNQKIPYQPQLYEISQKIKKDLTLSFMEQVQLLWNVNIDTVKQTPYSPPILMDYKSMTFYQISYYIYWRTLIRNGKMLYTDFAYIKLYIYELMLMVNSPNTAIDVIYDFYVKYPYNKESLNRFLQTVLKDYFLLHTSKLKYTYIDLLTKFSFSSNYKKEDEEFSNEIYSQSVEFYNKKSSYKILNSKFYATPIGSKIIPIILPIVFKNINEYLKIHGYNLTQLTYGNFVSFPYMLFRELNNQHFLVQTECINLNAFETYYYDTKQQSWFYKKRRNYTTASNLFGFIVKYTEKKLREYTKTKNKLTVNKNFVISDFVLDKKLQSIILDSQFEKIIDETIKDFIKTISKKQHISFNISNINEIQKTTTENEIKLKVEDYEENFDEIPIKTTQTKKTTHSSFLDNLTQTELEVIKLLLTQQDPRLFLNKNNIMPEIIYETINEKAIEYFGDYIIDTVDIPYIYEDYINDLEVN